jgi:hypothetical protein
LYLRIKILHLRIKILRKLTRTSPLHLMHANHNFN